jgi:tRNA A37 threonylcarbamoyladenosine dehydratase
VEIVMEFLTAVNADRLLAPAFDVVVDAIDGTTNKADLIGAAVRLGKRCVTVGGAGGKRDASQLRTGDLGEAWGDELLKMVRKKLRREHGFARGEGNRYGVRCIYSAENPTYPWADGSCNTEPEPGSNLKLDCASGFGTAVWVTGAMGLAAAQEAVNWVVND